jgi:DNA-binding CsgD family transcriptional regulator
VQFRHPLVRSVAYARASRDERRRAHRALADATNPATDPSRRAWHAAEATAGPDEQIASELEAAAEVAQARGGYAARAAFLRRAAELSGVPGKRVARVLGAAQAMQDAGTLDAGIRILATLRSAELTARDTAHVEWLRAYTRLVQHRGADAAGALVSAATGMTPHHPALAGEMWLAALEAARFGGRFGKPTVSDVAEAMRTTDAQAALQPVARDLLQALATLWADDFAKGVRALRPALKRLTDEGQAQDLVIRLLRVAESAAVDSLDDEAHHQLVEIHEQRARVLGTLANLNTALASGVEVKLNEGNLAAAERRTHELDELAEIQHAPRWHALTALVAAWQGDQGRLAECADQGIPDAVSRREGLAVSGIYLALAIDANAHCEFEAAARHAEQACADDHELGYATWALPELIEAAVRAGQIATARVALTRLQRLGNAAQSNWGLGLLAQATAQLSAGRVAAEEFERSIDHLERTRVVIALARTRLLYGEWLRRERQRGAAHHQLTLAHEMFDACGARSFAERAEAELRSTRPPGRRAPPASEHVLTGRELTVARMVATGHSNRAIAKHLFISEKTVEYHLGKVFAKLNVRSRTQLASKLEDAPTNAALDPSTVTRLPETTPKSGPKPPNQSGPQLPKSRAE